MRAAGGPAQTQAGAALVGAHVALQPSPSSRAALTQGWQLDALLVQEGLLQELVGHAHQDASAVT